MKTLIALYITAFVFGIGAIIYIAVGLPLVIQDMERFNKAPTTYETGLYVESEQLQQTIDGKELQ